MGKKKQSLVLPNCTAYELQTLAWQDILEHEIVALYPGGS